MIEKKNEIKDAAQSIIDNVDIIVGGYRYQTGEIIIKIPVDIASGGAAVVDVCHEYIPEKTAERIQLNSE